MELNNTTVYYDTVRESFEQFVSTPIIPTMPRHPNKHIQAAIEFAIMRGWTMVLSNGHAFGILRCGADGGTCQKSVWSTPRNPEDHARQIRRYVNKCRCDSPVTDETDEPEE